MFPKLGLNNLIIPPYIKWGALAVLAVAIFFVGFVKGIERTVDRQVVYDTKIIYKQGKTTQKIITKYVKVREEQKKVDEQIKKEGISYEIQFPNDDYHFVNEFVRLYDASVTGSLSTLSSGADGGDSGVTVPQVLETSIHNNTVARQWKERALTCELWAKEQEELYNGNHT